LYQMNAKPAGLPPDRTVPFFLSTMFPTGVLGLVLAATLAASLSSIASAINSCTTVAIVDFYERLFKRRKLGTTASPARPGEVLEYESVSGHGESARQDVMLSRVVTVCFGIIGVVLAANVERVGNLIESAQKVIQTF